MPSIFAKIFGLAPPLDPPNLNNSSMLSTSSCCKILLHCTLISSKLRKAREKYLAANRYEDVKNGKYVDEVLNQLPPLAYEIFSNNTVNVVRNLPDDVKQEILSYEE